MAILYDKKAPPTVTTDRSGTIIHYNKAAHDLCAALCIGDHITKLMDDAAKADYIRSVSSGLFSFTVKSAHKGIGTMLFDLTRDGVDGVRTVYLSKDLSPKQNMISYRDVAESFELAVRDGGFSGKRRFAKLYETLTASNSVFTANRRLALFPLRELMARFTEVILPSHLYTSGDIIYTEDESVNENSVICTEPYGFYLLLCAVTSTACHIAKSTTKIAVRDARDRAVITVSCDSDRADKYRTTADFGIRSIDLCYAKTIARACGYTLTHEVKRENDGIVFTITVKCHDYYPSYLKTDAGTGFMLDGAAISVVYPESTEE